MECWKLNMQRELESEKTPLVVCPRAELDVKHLLTY